MMRAVPQYPLNQQEIDLVKQTSTPVIANHLHAMNAGKTSSGRIGVGTMASGQPIAIPYMIAKGMEDGPCLWLNGAVHGDEINGSLAAIDFFNSIDMNDLIGSLIVTPVSNPLGFDARRKRVPQDEQDLDQSFPGRTDGLTSQVLARCLFAEIDAIANVVVNFHTMMPSFQSQPYAVYKVFEDGAVSEMNLLRAVAVFDPVVACRMNVEPTGNELPGNIAGALDYQCLKHGKTAFMIELGTGSCQQPDLIRHGVIGLRRLARHIGLLRAEDGDAHIAGVRRVTARTHVFCKEGGVFRQNVKPGTLLKRGDLLGRVQSTTGVFVEDVTFDDDVVVIGVRNDPVVHTGDRVGFVATEWDDVDF